MVCEWFTEVVGGVGLMRNRLKRQHVKLHAKGKLQGGGSTEEKV